MKKINKKALVTTSISNKATEHLNTRLYKKIFTDFAKLNWMWSKSFMIFMMERAEEEELKICGKRLHLEMKHMERQVYDRFMVHILTELKRDFFKASYGGTLANISDAMVSFGTEEFLVLNKVVWNCTKAFRFDNASLTQDMRKVIETSYFD